MHMSRGARRLVTTVALAVVCGCEAIPTHKRPPADSYTAGARQLKVGETVISVQGARVTPSFFRGAEVQPFVGRFFVEEDQGPAAQRIVVLSHDLWSERFASSPSVIGQEIEVDGRRTTVVGIAPPGFRFPDRALLWTLKDGGGH